MQDLHEFSSEVVRDLNFMFNIIILICPQTERLATESRVFAGCSF